VQKTKKHLYYANETEARENVQRTKLWKVKTFRSVYTLIQIS